MNDRVTIFMPVSRSDYLDRVFHNLEMLECDREKTNLFVMVDGDVKLFVDVRNRVELSKFAQRLCIQFKSKDKFYNYNSKIRRKRISEIHNESKKKIQECDYIFGIEDDTLFPHSTLKKLLNGYSMIPHAGFIQGVEMGRWGVPYVGAWKVDNIYEPKEINSLMPSDGLKEIDAGGFYCYLTTIDNYMMHFYKPFENNDLGPDFDFGIALRREGLLNYADWSIQCVHKSPKGDINFVTTQPTTVSFIKNELGWSFKKK